MSRKLTSVSPALGVLLSAAGIVAVVCGAAASRAGTQETTKVQLEQRFTTQVKPFLQTYCVMCHGHDKPQAQLDLAGYTSLEAAAKDYAHLGLMVEKLANKEMPPKSTRQPSQAQRDAVLTWLKGMRKYEAERNAGDPGLVLARRLSNQEYDYTIRDLTGVDIRPTREFPVDPADEEGFDNSGDTLTISPALMKKYMGAAKEVADHMVLASSNIQFAPRTVLAETDRDTYCILRIINFYKQQPTDYADYFDAAWKYRHRAALGMPNATLASIAAQEKVSPKYLQMVWDLLNTPGEKVGPVAELEAKFNALPAPTAQHKDAPREQLTEMRDWVKERRTKVAWHFANLLIPGGFSPGGQCFVLWKDRQYASHRRMLYPAKLQPGGKPQPRVEQEATPFAGLKGAKTIVDPVDPELAVPEDPAARAPYVKSYEKFCNVFPDAFYIPERGRMHIEDKNDKGRFLSAGLHNAMGYFRDDTPLSELILDDKGQKELDRLWLDFDCVAYWKERMHLEFFHYERAEAGTITGHEFDFARSEDPDATSEPKIKHLAEVYYAHAKKAWDQHGGDPVGLQAIKEHFERVNASIRAVEKARKDAEPSHLRDIVDFARRAWRRPLTTGERQEILAFYKESRTKLGLTHEDAMRDTLESILMSPKFLFIDLEGAPAAPSKAEVVRKVSTAKPTAPSTDGTVIQPLSDYALATRLSYFLWSSAPDEELLSHASAGDLHKPEVLTAQARRMLKDPRVRDMAVEFGANWLDFRRFEQYNGIDRERFPNFTDQLREAMFEEPIRFLTDMFQNDGSVLDMVYGKHTFVNRLLAKHYKMDADLDIPPNGWVRVNNADRYGRGGLLPMGVFLTQTSPGLRTSPVKRGYWVVRKLLGEHIPPPPPTVPQLPADESKLGNHTLRQALELHRVDPACAGCHARFDSFGLVFEGYGPTGEIRTKDQGGKAVDIRASFPGGSERAGLQGLQSFLKDERQTEFVDTFCRKLLSYSLGRGLQASDDPLLTQMRQQVTTTGGHVTALVESIVTSKQFRYRRAAAPASKI